MALKIVITLRTSWLIAGPGPARVVAKSLNWTQSSTQELLPAHCDPFLYFTLWHFTLLYIVTLTKSSRSLLWFRLRAHWLVTAKPNKASQCHSFTFYPDHSRLIDINVTISQCHNVTMSQCHNVIMSQRHFFTFALDHFRSIYITATNSKISIIPSSAVSGATFVNFLADNFRQNQITSGINWISRSMSLLINPIPQLGAAAKSATNHLSAGIWSQMKSRLNEIFVSTKDKSADQPPPMM